MPDIYISEQPIANGKQPPKPETHHALPGHTHNPLTSYCYLPDKVHFATQREKEVVVFLLRRHPITNLPWIMVAIALIFAPLLLLWFPLLSFLPTKFQIVAVAFWYLITMAFILEEALSWFFNVNIVTDQRIMDVDFYNLIYREISDTEIERIQDITFRVGGVVRTIFRFGDVLIQTAGTVPNFEFGAVPKPGEVTKILQELRSSRIPKQL